MAKRTLDGYLATRWSSKLNLKVIGPKQYQANCPFCVERGEVRPDTKQRLGISLDPKMFAVHCFNCGYSGNPLTLLTDLEPFQKSFVELRELLGDLGSEVPQVQSEQLEVGLPKSYRALLKGKVNMYHAAAIGYLADRNLTNNTIIDYQFGYCRMGRFQNRIIIPIRFNGRLVGYQGRAIKDTHVPKYLFNKGFKGAKYLFNYDRAIKRDTVIIVEGVFDALVFPKSSVAIFTNRLSDQQRLLIAKGWKNALIMLDAKEVERSYEVYKQLNGMMSCQVVKLKSKDPSGVGKLGVLDRLKHMVKGLDILVDG